MPEERRKSDGGMWIKKSEKGNEYLSGSIVINGEKIYFVAFKNDKKEGNQPDYNLKLSEKRG